MLRVSLTEAYEAKCREKDEDLVVLRREMLEAVTKFSSDEQYWKQILGQKERELHDEKVSCFYEFILMKLFLYFFYFDILLRGCLLKIIHITGYASDGSTSIKS